MKLLPGHPQGHLPRDPPPKISPLYRGTLPQTPPPLTSYRETPSWSPSEISIRRSYDTKRKRHYSSRETKRRKEPSVSPEKKISKENILKWEKAQAHPQKKDQGPQKMKQGSCKSDRGKPLSQARPRASHKEKTLP